MRNFNFNRALSILFFICIMIYAIIIFVFNNTFKKIYNDSAEWIVVGNSHAYKILLDTTSIYYLNQDGSSLDDRVKQIEFALNEFKSSKYVIINVSPLEVYKKFNFLMSENDYLYKENLLNLFENKLVHSPLFLFKNKSYEDHFLSNGRRVSYGIHGEKYGDWIRKSHTDDGHYPERHVYDQSFIKIQQMINMLKPRHTVILISMPLHEIYFHHLESYLTNYDVPELSRFFYDMSHLNADCYINLTTYPMPDAMFWDGDHLNENGAIAIKPILNNIFRECISRK